MKKIFKSLTAVSAATVLAFTGSAVSPLRYSTPAMNAVAADDCNDDWLHAEGSRLYDMNGNEVWLTGANWFGLNCTENVPHGLYARDIDDMMSSIADHGINIIRFPISTELLMSWMEGEPQPVSSVQASYNPPQDEIGEDGTVTPAGKYGNINKEFVLEDGKTLKNSMEIFDIIMAKCKKYGVKALIDVHSPASHNSGHNYNLWYYEPTADDCDGMATNHLTGEPITWDNWIDSITWLAEKYSNDDTILAYDLKNEPHGKRMYSGSECPSSMAKWDDSTDKNNWKYSAEECAKSILSVNPNALILIEGIEQSPRTEKGVDWNTPDKFQPAAGEEKWYGAWWGGNLRGVRDLPVLPESSQIVYSPHDYGPSVYAQSWFDKDFTEQTLLDDYWYDTWAYINAEDIAPLLIGEWGGHMDKGDNQKWMELLRDYMINNHINHTFWCINPNSGDTGGLLDNSFLNWDDNKYGLFEEALWQTSGGTYIGLDHQTALGSNGLSLNEFYASAQSSNLDGGKSNAGGTPIVVDKTSVSTTTTTTTTTTTLSNNSATTTTTTTTIAETAPVMTWTAAPDYYYKSFTPPTKTTYTVGEDLDLSGLTVIFSTSFRYESMNSMGTISSSDHRIEFNTNPNCFLIDIAIITAEDETEYELDEFSKLPVGEYNISIPYSYRSEYGRVEFSVEIVEGSPSNTTESDITGDSNLDGEINISDAVIIMQALANPSKYGENGTDTTHITSQGVKNSDCDGSNDGMTNIDALTIQKYILGLVKTLPAK